MPLFFGERFGLVATVVGSRESRKAADQSNECSVHYDAQYSSGISIRQVTFCGSSCICTR